MTQKHKNQVDIALSLNSTLTAEQKSQLVEIAKACESLGATKESLSPLYAVVFLIKPVEEDDESQIKDIITTHEVTRRCIDTKIGQQLEAEAKRKTGKIDLP